MPNETQHQDVSLQQAEAACKEANEGADQRDEFSVDWKAILDVPSLQLSLDQFEHRIGQRFELELGQHDAQLELVEATPQGDPQQLPKGAPERPPFSLVFRGHSSRAAVPEGWYQLRHEEMGAFEIWLTPLSRDFGQANHQTAHLEAVFN